MSDPSKEELEALADEAERGYDPATIKPIRKYRITIRRDDIELRGYIKGDDPRRLSDLLHNLGKAMEPFGALVIASPADDTYSPFALEDL